MRCFFRNSWWVAWMSFLMGLNGTVHPNRSFTHPHVVPNICDIFSMEHKILFYFSMFLFGFALFLVFFRLVFVLFWTSLTSIVIWDIIFCFVLAVTNIDKITNSTYKQNFILFLMFLFGFGLFLVCFCLVLDLINLHCKDKFRHYSAFVVFVFHAGLEWHGSLQGCLE